MAKFGVFLVVALFSMHASASFRCIGTEPFWNATLTEEVVNVNTMEGVQYHNQISEVSGAAGYVASYIQVFSNLRGPVAVVKQAKCSDGMSDKEYDYEAIIFTDLVTLYGCCRKARTR